MVINFVTAVTVTVVIRVYDIADVNKVSCIKYVENK